MDLQIDIPEDTRQAQPSTEETSTTKSSPTENQSSNTQEKKKREPPKINIESTNKLAKLHFSFGFRFIRYIRSLGKKSLQDEDVECINLSYTADELEKRFTYLYNEYKATHSDHSKALRYVLMTLFKKAIITHFFYQTIYWSSRILIPFFMFKMIPIILDSHRPNNDRYHYASGFFLMFLVGLYCMESYTFNTAYDFGKMQSGLLGMLLRKLSRLEVSSLSIINQGKIQVLVTSQVNCLQKAHLAVMVVVGPLMIAGALGLLYYIWGLSSLVGVGYLIFVVIIKQIFTKIQSVKQEQQEEFAERRVSLLIEIVEAINAIKLYAWELDYINILRTVRRLEINYMKMANFLIVIPKTLLATCQMIGAFLVFITYTQIEGPLNSNQVYPTIILFTYLMRMSMAQITEGVTFISEFKSLSSSVAEIMDLREKDVIESNTEKLKQENSIEFDELTGYWNHIQKVKKPSKRSQSVDQLAPFSANYNNVEVLSDDRYEYKPLIRKVFSEVNLHVKTGNLVCIIGPPGSGKSSLLLAITGELYKIEGNLSYRGTYAHVSQGSMLHFGTVCDNVVFGRKFDEELFWKVIDVCLLTEDVKALPEGHLTNIGERGIRLSLEQQKRLTLARALYVDADIYLLDDPLSSLEADVANKLYKGVILNYLKHKTVLLVTPSKYLARHADEVVLMESGKIVKKGSYSDTIKIDDEYSEDSEIHHDQNQNRPLPRSELTKIHQSKYQNSMDGKVEKKRHIEQNQEKPVCNNLIPFSKEAGLHLNNKRLDPTHVHSLVYWNYVKLVFWNRYGLVTIILLLGSEAFPPLFMIMSSKWATKKLSDLQAYIIIGSILGGAVICISIKLIFYFHTYMDSAKRLYDNFVTALIMSPLKLFHQNPLGNIVNRFSSDFCLLDKFILIALLEVIQSALVFIAFSFIIWINDPRTLVAWGALIIFFALIKVYCRGTVRKTRELSLTTRAPVFGFFYIQSEDLVNIRIHNQTDNWIHSFYNTSDRHARGSIAYLISSKFENFLLDYVNQAVIIGLFCYLLSVDDTPLKTGFFFEMLTFCASVMQWLLHDFFYLNMMMTGPARLIKFCQNSKSNNHFLPNDKNEEFKDWPKHGEVQVQNASLSETHSVEPYINKVSFHINPGEKIAVIGKSSPDMSSIMHMLSNTVQINYSSPNEPQSFVKIDGVDIDNIGQQLLRKSLNIIPEGSYILSGSVYNNIDPWGKYSEEQVWKALEEVQLKKFVEELPYQLHTHVRRGSSVFSVGQKQLLTLARGLLKNSKLVLQDSVSQHIDSDTYQTIQKDMLERFNNDTVITMLRNLVLAARYDRVMIIREGKIVEFDEPYRLLVRAIGDNQITNRKGYFGSMVAQLGKDARKDLFELAINHYYNKTKGCAT